MAKSKVNKINELLRPVLGNIEIIEEDVKLLTGPGEHYGSVMLGLNIKFKEINSSNNNNNNNNDVKNLELVAKLIPANEMLRLAFDIPVTFKKEVFCYKETIPALVQLQKEFGIPENEWHDKLFPKCYGARVSVDENKNIVDEDAVLLFENLKTQRFITEDRLTGFDLSATKIILKDLAKFHAVPIALKLIKPEIFQSKVAPAFVSNKGLEQLPEEIGLSFHNSIMDGAKEIPELAPFLDRLEKIAENGLTNPWVLRTDFKEPWTTLCHADFWVSNTMIRKDDNGITKENKIIDLQLVRYWSCCCDLVFFLFTSVINTILDKHFDELLHIYYQTFVDTLKQFKIEVNSTFSWASFLIEFKEVAPTELYHVLVMLKPICTERGKVTNNSEEFQDTDWSRKDLLGPNHRRKLKDTVFSLNKQGLI